MNYITVLNVRKFDEDQLSNFINVVERQYRTDLPTQTDVGFCQTKHKNSRLLILTDRKFSLVWVWVRNLKTSVGGENRL